MKNKIKNLLLKKRIKIMKNNKGFSLLEVLVGVTIIGIISAIAVPRFKNYRDTAALTAAESTGKNVAKAYNLCAATSSACASMEDLNISCDTCETPVNPSGGTDFCVPMKQTISGSEFRSCVSVNKSNGKVTQTYGGEFKFCHKKCKLATATGCTQVGDEVVTAVKKCDKVADCPNGDNTNYNTNPICKANNSNSAGTCDSATGVCKST